MTAILRQTEGTSLLPADARDYLAGLLASPDFRASPRRRALLNHIVEQTLAGRSHRLKAFDLAVTVLGRDERFDPQNDPIVRIEVGRLRRDLEHYYQGAGERDSIRITIPKGRYVPAFAVVEASEPALASKPPADVAPYVAGWRTRRVYAPVAGLCLLLLAAAVYGWATWRGPDSQAAGPAVIVLPFEPLAGGEGGQLLASGLTGDLITELMRFDGLQVFAGLPTTREGDTQLPAAAAGAFTYVVAGSVQREPDRVRVTARLSERDSSQVLWSQSYDRALTAADIYDVQAELSDAIVGRLAQGYGVITADVAKRLQRSRPATLFAYDCVQRAFAYRRTFAKELYPPVRACLEEAVRRDPEYAAAWAMLAFAHLDAARFGFVDPTARESEMQTGLALARRAVELAPASVTSLQSLAALQYMSGDVDAAEQVQRQAIALNPHNPESMAQLGWRLNARGRSEEAASMLQEAIDRSISPPPWYYANLALAQYLLGDLARARDNAELGKGHCCGVGHAALAITEAAVGHAEAAQAALDEATRQAPILSRDPRAFWTNFGVADAVIERLNVGLAKAGLQLQPAAAAPASRS